MTVADRQRKRLREATFWASRIREVLGPIVAAHGSEVHFRPSSSGVAMVGLLRGVPLRGKGGIRNVELVARNFEALFAEHCRDVPRRDITEEQSLQRALLSDAHAHGRKLDMLNRACRSSTDSTELTLVTDHLVLPTEAGDVTFDVLALRRDGGRSTPVVIALKHTPELTDSVSRSERLGALLDSQGAAFQDLYAAVLGEPVPFDGPAERWVLRRPAVPEPALDTGAVRVVFYRRIGHEHEFGSRVISSQLG